MPASLRLLGLSGSLRKNSFSTAILETVAEALAAEAQFTFGDIGALPHYNQDDDGETPPASVAALRRALTESQGLLIVTPEYNHSIPGVLKNSIDWLSRPAFASPLAGKPVLFIASSHAVTGGVRALPHLREAFVSAHARLVTTKDVVIGNVDAKITAGRLTDRDSLAHVVKAVKLLIADARTVAA